MNRCQLAVVAILLGFALMSCLAFVIVPPWAVGMIERGEELSLPVQVVIAAGNLWARYFVIWILLTLGALAFLVRGAMRAPAR